MWGEAGPNCRRGNAEGIGGAGGAEPESGSATAPTPRLAASRVIWGEGTVSPCPSAPCGAVATRAEDPCPRGDATARGTGSIPEAPELPAGNSCRGCPGGCSGSGAPRRRRETPKWGSPLGGGGSTARAARGVPGSVASEPLRSRSAARPGAKHSGSSPGRAGGLPARGGEGAPLPPPPAPRSPPSGAPAWAAAAKSLATRNGHRGLRGAPGSAGRRGGATAGAGPERSGAGGSARGRGRRGGPGRAAAGDAGAFTCSGGGSRLSAARPAPKRGDGRRTHPRLRLPAPFQAGGPGAGGGQGNAAGAEQIPALEPGLREEKGCSSSLRQAKSPARAGGAGQRCQARGAPPARLGTARLDAARLGWDGHGAVRLAGGRVQGCGGARHGSARYGLARSGTAQHGRLGSVPARHGTVRFGRALRGSVTARSHKRLGRQSRAGTGGWGLCASDTVSVTRGV